MIYTPQAGLVADDRAGCRKRDPERTPSGLCRRNDRKTYEPRIDDMTAESRPNTTKLARGLILVAAGLSMALSVGIWFLADDKLAGIFVGTWVPSILALGALVLPRPAP